MKAQSWKESVFEFAMTDKVDTRFLCVAQDHWVDLLPSGHWSLVSWLSGFSFRAFCEIQGAPRITQRHACIHMQRARPLGLQYGGCAMLRPACNQKARLLLKTGPLWECMCWIVCRNAGRSSFPRPDSQCECECVTACLSCTSVRLQVTLRGAS